MSWSGREALQDVWEWSRGPQIRERSGGPLVRPVVVEMPSRISSSVRAAHPDFREWSSGLPNFREWSGGPPKYLGVVDRPSKRSGSGREALPEDREWSGGPPGCPVVVGRPSR